MSLRLVLALAVAGAPAALGAQTGNGSTRLAGRVPAAALPAIDSILAAAVAESLPTEPLVQKALEGSAKNIPVDRLVNGVRRGYLQLRQARAIVSRAVPGQAPPEGHVAAVAAALARGLSGPVVERLLTAAPNEPPGPALHAAADLVAHHFDPDSAADLLVDAHNKGLRGVRLLDVAMAADHELQRPGGRTPSEALAHVRAMLPNVRPGRP
ncbi:MAG TPA: hypothetical protein VKC15_11865 [Gemmatimonadales bacterium]|nr:hypothetical protein [Gemmatimonadales bacterium]